MPRKLKPVQPGEMLREEFMKRYGLSMNELAMDLHSKAAVKQVFPELEI